MPTKSSFDRSTMFTCLLDISAPYGGLDSKVGERITTEALAAWYESTAVDMYAFTKEWIKTKRKDLLPFRPTAK